MFILETIVGLLLAVGILVFGTVGWILATTPDEWELLWQIEGWSPKTAGWRLLMTAAVFIALLLYLLT